MSSPRTQAGRFRLILAVGAAVNGVLGVLGLFTTAIFETAIGAEVAILTPGFDAVARLYGGVLIVMAISYAIATVQPHRSLLAVLFAMPLMTAAVTIAATARGELDGVRGGVWAAFYVVYCLVFLRLYPRVDATAPAPEEGDLAQPSEASEDPPDEPER